MIVYITVVILLFPDGNSPIISDPNAFRSAELCAEALDESLKALPDEVGYEARCVPVVYGEDI